MKMILMLLTTYMSGVAVAHSGHGKHTMDAVLSQSESGRMELALLCLLLAGGITFLLKKYKW